MLDSGGMDRSKTLDSTSSSSEEEEEEEEEERWCRPDLGPVVWGLSLGSCGDSARALEGGTGVEEGGGWICEGGEGGQSEPLDEELLEPELPEEDSELVEEEEEEEDEDEEGELCW